MLTFTTSRSSQARRSSAFSRSKAAANDLRTLWAGIVSVQAIVRPMSEQDKPPACPLDKPEASPTTPLDSPSFATDTNSQPSNTAATTPPALQFSSDAADPPSHRSEEHTSELQSLRH